MLLESGTSKLDQVSLSRKIGAQTGGISASYYSDLKHTSGKIANPDDTILYFLLRGKAVRDKIPTLLELIYDVLSDANLGNQKRAIEILKEKKIQKQSSVVSSGHTYAATRLAAR
jgi:Zn-dependent M16 (insulinase) family peptidase